MDDYLGNKEAAYSLAKRIEYYYHSKGFTQVIAEVIPVIERNSFGDKVRTRYDVRSNLRFNCAGLK